MGERWAALGWAREKGKGEVMGRTGLGFGFGLGWVLGFLFAGLGLVLG